jgi:hypothetical protein
VDRPTLAELDGLDEGDPELVFYSASGRTGRRSAASLK